MIKHAFNLVTILLLLSTYYCLGQDQNSIIFLPEGSAYTTQLEDFLKLAPDKQRNQTLKSFSDFIANYQPEENEWIELASLSNSLLRRGIKPYPEFNDFIMACSSFQKDQLAKQSFIIWLSQTQKSIEAEKITLVQARRMWKSIISFNLTQELFDSGSSKWTLKANDYSLKTDTALYLSFSGATLTGKSGNEESSISNTSGRYYFINQIFISESGQVNWSGSGIEKDQVYAQLEQFQLNLSKSVFVIDSTWLYDMRYFENPILGRIELRVATGMPEARKAYPKFISYNRKNQIKNLYPGMDYTGGYTLQGRKIIGANINNEKGTLLIYYQSTPQVRLSAEHFMFTPERAQSVNTELSIYLESDSIYHPGLSFQYQHTKKEVAFMRDGRGLSNSRFFNTYHDFDLDVEMVIWNPEDSIMKLSGMVGSLQNKTGLESADYYSIDRFNEIQVADIINPLVQLKRCSEHFDSRFYLAGDLSEFMSRPYHLVVEMLLNVSFLGFVRYDSESDLVEVNQRTFDFLAKHAGLQDYDIIRFRSDMLPPKANGYLNLKSGDLKINGVSKINLSVERNVVAFPTGQVINIKKDRNIWFDGFLQCGLVGFTGTGFNLLYESFELKMEHIESIKIQVHVPLSDNDEETTIEEISSIIENTSGSVLIDHPQNKSGLLSEDYPDYPMFIADSTAYVYFDQSFIQNGAYSREDFYFSTDTLIIKGLNSVNLKDRLSFSGQFRTAEIFPEIKVNLSYQEDHSLGFSTLYTPDTGYQIYNDKGRFYNEINMSNEGLTGNGTVEYQGASIESDKFLFLPDEMISKVKNIDVHEGLTDAGSPKATADNVDISWKPEKELMLANPNDGLISLYEDVNFDGELKVVPEGLQGSGILRMLNYTIESGDFTFLKRSFTAENASFSITSQFQDTLNSAGNSITTDLSVSNSRVHIDLSDSTAFIQPIQENSIIHFPENKFKAKFETIDWRLNGNMVKISQPKLVSELASQDGLSMAGSSATYDLNSYKLDVEGMEYVDIADVRIYPENERVTIRPNAFIDSLPSCTILPRDTSVNHVINRSLVHLYGKNNYRASGAYTYTDKAEREFVINMENIGTNAQGHSFGQGQISIGDGFYLSPAFAFQGKAELLLNEPLLNFDGAFQLTHDCVSTTKKWIKMNSRIDPASISIPLDSLTKDIDGREVYSGFFLSNQPIELYSTFLGPHTRYSDHPVIQSAGFIQFDELSGDYRLASEDKLSKPEGILPEMRLDRENCTVFAEGKLSLGLDLGRMEIEAAGSASHNLKTDSVSIHSILTADFLMNEKALEYVAKELNNYYQAQAVNYSDQGVRRSLLYYVGQESGQSILDQLSLTGGFRKLPDEFLHTFFFTQLDLKWNPDRGSYQSVGKIGIGNILTKPVNKLFNGHIEIVHRRGGDSFTLYLETDPGSYFFFYYSRGLMQVLAGPKFEKFNNLITDTKEGKRKASSEAGEINYQYYLGQYRLVRTFLDEINGN